MELIWLLWQSDIEKIFSFIISINKLKKTYRYSQVTNKQWDSVADHCRRLGMMWILFNRKLNLWYDDLKILMLAQCHDLAEIVDWDIDVSLVYNWKITHEQKDEIEKENIKKIISCLPQDLQTEIFEFWEDYRLWTSQEAKFMKTLDKIEATLHYMEYDFENDSMIWFLGYHWNKEAIKSPQTKQILKISKKLLKQFLVQRWMEWEKEYDEY